MRPDIKLSSSLTNGLIVGVTDTLEMLYSYLLAKHGETNYSRIHVHQIGMEEKEQIIKQTKKSVFINIRVSGFKNDSDSAFASDLHEALTVLHTGLSRIAEYEGKLSKEKLDVIKSEILSNKFLFYIPIRRSIKKASPSISATILVRPSQLQFDYILQISEGETVLADQVIYEGRPSLYYWNKFFYTVKWRKKNEVVVTGQANEVEIVYTVDSQTVTVHNLTQFETPPWFQMCKVGVSEEQRKKSYDDWFSTLSAKRQDLLRQQEEYHRPYLEERRQLDDQQDRK